ncbi:MAG: universal stress protein [Sphingomonadaceae bacterium]
MRIYLVVMDETEEALRALRFASHRAIKTGGDVHILALVPKQSFSAFGGIQATIEQEAHDKAEVLASSAAGSIFAESGKMPSISVIVGNGAEVIGHFLAEHPEVKALVLGAGKDGSPGPLVTHFAAHAGSLGCPLYIVPGSFSDEDIDRMA